MRPTKQLRQQVSKAAKRHKQNLSVASWIALIKRLPICIAVIPGKRARDKRSTCVLATQGRTDEVF